MQNILLPVKEYFSLHTDQPELAQSTKDLIKMFFGSQQQQQQHKVNSSILSKSSFPQGNDGNNSAKINHVENKLPNNFHREVDDPDDQHNIKSAITVMSTIYKDMLFALERMPDKYKIVGSPMKGKFFPQYFHAVVNPVNYKDKTIISTCFSCRSSGATANSTPKWVVEISRAKPDKSISDLTSKSNTEQQTVAQTGVVTSMYRK